MLLASLVFVPVSVWETYVPVAAVVAVLGVILAGIAVEMAGDRLVRPIRRLVRSIENSSIGDQSLHDLVRQAPAEMAPLLYGLHVTHARLRRTLRQLEQDRADMSAIFEHMADSVLVLDADERVILSNPAANRMLNGQPLGRSLAGLTRDAELVELARSVSETGTDARLIELYTDSGERRWIQAVATPLPEERRLLVLRDISGLRRAEVARRDFVANVSHELRTPVAALKALVETLEQGAIDDPVEGPGFLHLMHIEVDGLAQLVTELLDLARAEAGRLDLSLSPCDASELLREAAARAAPSARKAGLDLEVSTPMDEAELLVCADDRRMGQVLSNLLANATKFTPPDGRIEAGVRRREDYVEFWVSDTGLGIEPEHLMRVFERFYKTDPARAAGSGTGLGLAIAKHLVLAHGGQIWAESAGQGRGSTFRVALPALNE